MLQRFINWMRGVKPQRRIAFIDGDQNLDRALAAYDAYIANTGTETHFVRLAPPANHKEPKQIRNREDFNKVYLEGAAGKEVVDKFIAGYIQRAVAEGYTHVTVVSNDYDFIDIFKMAVMINEHASEVTFRMVVPFAQGRMAELPPKVSNIEVVKIKTKRG